MFRIFMHYTKSTMFQTPMLATKVMNFQNPTHYTTITIFQTYTLDFEHPYKVSLKSVKNCGFKVLSSIKLCDTDKKNQSTV